MVKPAEDRTTIEITSLIVLDDGSKVAAGVLPVVRQLAELTGAGVRLLTSTFGGGAAAPQGLGAAEQHLAGVDVDRVIVDDRPAAEAAVDLALATDGGLLCLSTHGRSGPGRVVLGSVADRVIRSGLVPVLVIGPSCDPDALERPGPVALCIDGSTRSDDVMDAGLQWARLLGRDARMILVSNPFDGVTRQQSTELFDRLDGAHGSAGVQLSGTDVVNGSVAWGLVTEQDVIKSPLMVIAPVARSRWERLLLGSTTLAVLRGATCPVLVLADQAATDRSVSR
jgi:nucleotide-binding universal stress UspA family protein